MIITKDVFNNMINSPKRSFMGRVEIFEGSTLALICGCHENLKSFTVERIGEKNKVFGYGICQKLIVDFIDRDRTLNITKEHNLEVEFGVGSDYVYPCPNFYVEEVQRDEKTNEIKVTAYDALYKASNHTVSELELMSGYTIKQFAEACATLLGLPMVVDEAAAASFDTHYPSGANFEGTETIREALNAVAEATQTIYFIDYNWNLRFRRLKANSPEVFITKEKYMELNNKGKVVLTGLTHATELGDNLTITNEIAGVSNATQIIRNNPFWELREDAAELLDSALAAVYGLTVERFDCSWRGNFLLEIGDYIGLTTKNDGIILSYLLDDTFTFNGGLSGKTQWEYEPEDEATSANPTSLGEAIKQTYARVDKANKQIDIVVSEVDATKEAISALQINTESINASVSKFEEVTEAALEGALEDISTLKSSVEAQITAEDITLAIQSELDNGVNKVTTSTGFTFNEEGLKVSKTDSEMETQITEDGMQVFKNNQAVLTANNVGVDAVNLHATTYLIIGSNSRLEDFNGRTGCFWIGG